MDKKVGSNSQGYTRDAKNDIHPQRSVKLQKNEVCEVKFAEETEKLIMSLANSKSKKSKFANNHI